MSNRISDKEEQVHKIFSAVFSQKPSVSKKRVAILQALSMCTEGKMKFRDIFREIQSKIGGIEYSSQNLTYDLHVLKQNGLINQTWDGEYTITENGCSLLAMYQEIERKVSEPGKRERTGFVGEVNGRIRAERFDPVILGEELVRLAFFRKKFLPSKEKFCLELKDNDDNFRSEIEIRKSGHFSVRIVLFHHNPRDANGFLDDFDKSEEWYETARGITQTVVYHIKRAVTKIWQDSEVVVPLKPDSYPI